MSSFTLLFSPNSQSSLYYKLICNLTPYLQLHVELYHVLLYPKRSYFFLLHRTHSYILLFQFDNRRVFYKRFYFWKLFKLFYKWCKAFRCLASSSGIMIGCSHFLVDRDRDGPVCPNGILSELHLSKKGKSAFDWKEITKHRKLSSSRSSLTSWLTPG